MAENTSPAAASGAGFMAPSLPSPTPSTTSSTQSIPSTTTSIRSSAGLPHPRRRPLRPGSAREDRVRQFAFDRMQRIHRGFVTRHDKTPRRDTADADAEGYYNSMADLCKDLDSLIDILWLSGTPSLQIPILLRIAGEFNTWVAGFPPSPRATLAILHKLDHCFASLLSGEDMETHEPLPGFEKGLRSGMSRTDMVRCKSVVQYTRVVVVDVMSKEAEAEADDEDQTMAAGDETGDETDSGPAGKVEPGAAFWDEDEERFYMDVGSVYENTLVKLGETLGEGGLEEIKMSAD